MPKSKPSTRALDEITVTCGLMTFAARLYTGTADVGLKRKEFITVPVMEEVEEEIADVDNPGQTVKVKVKVQKTVEVEVIENGETVTKTVPVFEDHSVGRTHTDKDDENRPLTQEEKDSVERKVETEYGAVFVTDEEIEKALNLEAKSLIVKEFQPQHLFRQGTYVPKGLNYLEPGRASNKKPLPAAIKGLNLLYEGMRKEGVVAVCELTTRGIPKPAILTPNGEIWLVYHTEEIREQRELPEVPVAAAEVTMVQALINTMKTTEVADLSDRRSTLIQTFADEKAAAGDFALTPDTFVQPVVEEAEMDFTAILQASVEAAAKAQAQAS